MQNIDAITWVNIVSTIITIIGACVTIFVVIYKAKPEKRKIDADADSSIADAAESIVGGAKVSNDLLLQRLEEMDRREIKREEDLSKLKNNVAEMETSLADWQNWAERLAYQVKSLGHSPVPFKVYAPIEKTGD